MKRAHDQAKKQEEERAKDTRPSLPLKSYALEYRDDWYGKIPVVLYSDISITELQKRAQECGATGFLRKTNDEEDVIRQVKAWVSQQQAAQASPPAGR